MTRVISIVNQKGGVGKTTTSINLSSSLGKLGKKTLLIDLDPQGNTSTGLGINKGEISASIYECLKGEVSTKDAIIKTKFDRLSILPSTINLAGIGLEINIMAQQDPEFRMNEQLLNVIEPIKKQYDYIIIDCPPSLDLLTTNALCASDAVIIPVQCEYFALEGITQLLNSIMMAQKNINPNLDIEGVLLTMLDSRTLLGLEVVEDIRRFFKERVYNTIIPRLVKLTEAPSHGKPIIAYDPKHRATEAYLNLAKEVIERNGNA
jgi:chromosome partitioning protein